MHWIFYNVVIWNYIFENEITECWTSKMRIIDTILHPKSDTLYLHLWSLLVSRAKDKNLEQLSWICCFILPQSYYLNSQLRLLFLSLIGKKFILTYLHTMVEFIHGAANVVWGHNVTNKWNSNPQAWKKSGRRESFLFTS